MADDTRLEEAYLLLNYSQQNQIPAQLLEETSSATSATSAGEEPRGRHLKLVAIHLGAGNGNHEAQSLELARSICQEVMLESRRHQEVALKRDCSKLCGCNQPLDEPDRCSAEWAAVELVRRMEDHQALNCGFGSNLNLDGQVECDASLMSDRSEMWAGVGALAGCRNPILLAHSLYQHRAVPRPLGLIQPNLLVASGARQWMRKHCSHLATAESKLVSAKAFAHYQRLKSSHDTEVRRATSRQEATLVERALRQDEGRAPGMGDQGRLTPRRASSTSFDHGSYCMQTGAAAAAAAAGDRTRSASVSEARREEPRQLESSIRFQHQQPRLDTVGAVVVDSENTFVSAISSGGLLLKYRGRVGQAAVPGAGCWSEDSVAATATGVGEYLTLSLFARKFYDKMLTLRMLHDLGHVEKEADLGQLISCGVHECFRDLARCSALAHVLPQQRLAGILSVCTLNSRECPTRSDEHDLYLSYAHNTPSMCVGYMTSHDQLAHSLMSRYRAGEKDNRASVKTIKLSLKKAQ